MKMPTIGRIARGALPHFGCMKAWGRLKLCLVMAIATVGLAACNDPSFPLVGGGSGLAPGSGIERTMTGVTYKTFAAPVDAVGKAVLQSLNYMDISLTGVQKSEQGWLIEAAAGKRTVTVQLDALTANTTAMRVMVDRGDPFFKDGATATEIVLQTADALTGHGSNIGQAAVEPTTEPPPAAVPAKAKKRRL